MRFSIVLSILFIIGGVHGFAGNPSKKQVIAPIKNFLIDPSKPYVYLQIDHIGPRVPSSEDEPATGIYLKLVNNCRVPIIVDTFGVPDGAEDDESGVMDSVVLNPRGFGDGIAEHMKTDLMPDLLLLNIPDEFLSPELRKSKARLQAEEQEKALTEATREKAQKEAELKELTERPTGYNFHVGSLTTIPPGMAVYFSVPINHVNKKWHFEIRFNFDLQVRGPIHEPYCYVAFYWEDLPKAYR